MDKNTWNYTWRQKDSTSLFLSDKKPSFSDDLQVAQPFIEKVKKSNYHYKTAKSKEARDKSESGGYRQPMNDIITQAGYGKL
jgi:hypothetical protein